MSKIQRLQANTRMCEAAIYNNTVYLAGQVAVNSAGQGAYAQTQEVLNAIDSLLAEAGSHKSNILRAQIFLADMNDFAEMNKAWDEWVDRNNPPARATVEAKLANPGWKVEIVITAAL